MNLKNRTYSSYYIDEIDSWGDLGDAVRKFGDKIHDNYEFLFPDDPNLDLGEAVFGKNKINAQNSNYYTICYSSKCESFLCTNEYRRNFRRS